jgi:MOSC domain-containing protein YiiM
MSVYSVSMSAEHSFSKSPTSYIYLLNNLGVQGDVHCSATPSSSNLRQVSLVASELFTDLAKPSSKYPSFTLSSGALGENITTSGVDLISLSEGTKLHFGDHEGHAIVRVTGLRDPKKRLGEWPEGLLERCAVKDKKGKVTGRKVGVMGVVEADGYVQPGYVIYVEKPKHHRPLGNV